MKEDGARQHGLILVAVCFLYYLPGVFSPRDFWVADEARYADVLREMIEKGHWLVTYLNGEFYPDKPPAYFWLCAAVSRLGGAITPRACLVVTWLSALGTVLATYALGRSISGARPAFLGTLAMVATLLFLGCAQIVRMDMLLAFFVVVAAWAFWEGFRRRRARYYAVFYLAAGLAILAKGPLGLAFPFLPAVAFLLWRREWKELRRFAAGPGILVTILLVGGWLAAAWMAGEQEFVRNLFATQIAGRAVKAFSHPAPFFFYAVLLPFILLPWFPFLVRAVGTRERPVSDDHLFLLLWFTAGLVLISAISGKLFIYVLPLVPPLAILLGEFLAEILDERRHLGRAFMVEGLLASVLMFGLLGAVLWTVRRVPPWDACVPGWTAVVFLVVGAGAVVLSVCRRAAVLFLVLFVGTWAFSSWSMLYLAGRANPYFSGRSVGEEIARQSATGKDVRTSGVIRGIFSFYAGQAVPMLAEGDIVPYLEKPRRVVVTHEKEYTIRKAVLDRRARVSGRCEIAGRKYVVLESKASD